MVTIVAPYYFRVGPETVYAYFKEIAANSPVDVMLYNIPAFASGIDPGTVRRLADECERIVAIKDSSGNLPNMMRMIESVRPDRPDFTFFTGTDSMLMPMVLIGCDGGIHASSGIVPELTRALYERTAEGKIDEARALQVTVQRLYEAMGAAVEFPEGYRAGVSARGFDMGPGRQPLTADQRAALEKFRDRLSEMIAEAGLS
jgi:4-hydroxy-tetrahydrodipicolinate synthase